MVLSFMTTRPRRNILSRKVSITILAPILVVAAYLFWPSSDVLESDIFIPVDLTNIPAGLMVVKTDQTGVEIRVRGPRPVLEKLGDLKLRYSIDLGQAKTGIASRPILKKEIKLPRGVALVALKPQSITFELDHEIKRQVPVIVAFSGQPATGYYVTDAKTTPAHVIVRGPRDRFQGVETVATKPVDVTGLRESFKKEVTADPPEGLDIISPKSAIRAEIAIAEKVVTRAFENIPVKGRNTTFSYRISPQAIHMEIKGPLLTLEELKAKNGLEVSIDLTGLKPGVYVRRASITLPVKTSLLGAEPELFTITIQDR